MNVNRKRSTSNRLSIRLEVLFVNIIKIGSLKESYPKAQGVYQKRG